MQPFSGPPSAFDVAGREALPRPPIASASSKRSARRSRSAAKQSWPRPSTRSPPVERDGSARAGSPGPSRQASKAVVSRLRIGVGRMPSGPGRSRGSSCASRPGLRQRRGGPATAPGAARRTTWCPSPARGQRRSPRASAAAATGRAGRTGPGHGGRRSRTVADRRVVRTSRATEELDLEAGRRDGGGTASLRRVTTSGRPLEGRTPDSIGHRPQAGPDRRPASRRSARSRVTTGCAGWCRLRMMQRRSGRQ